jgi:serine/threonine protein phosphatase PrpC
VLADGLGGHGGGDAAAQIAVDTIVRAFEQNPEVSTAAVEAHLCAANTAVRSARGSNGTASAMCTTAVVLLSDSRWAAWAHVGDSRLYHLRDGLIRFQTKDHSVPQALAAAGDISADQIRHHEDRNRILRALGSDDTVRPATVAPVPLHSGDAFLLCSDGLWEPVTEANIEQAFAGATDAGDFLARLETQIRTQSGECFDNYSGMVVWPDLEASGEVV